MSARVLKLFDGTDESLTVIKHLGHVLRGRLDLRLFLLGRVVVEARSRHVLLLHLFEIFQPVSNSA